MVLLAVVLGAVVSACGGNRPEQSMDEALARLGTMRSSYELAMATGSDGGVGIPLETGRVDYGNGTLESIPVGNGVPPTLMAAEAVWSRQSPGAGANSRWVRYGTGEAWGLSADYSPMAWFVEVVRDPTAYLTDRRELGEVSFRGALATRYEAVINDPSRRQQASDRRWSPVGTVELYERDGQVISVVIRDSASPLGDIALMFVFTGGESPFTVVAPEPSQPAAAFAVERDAFDAQP